METFHCPRCGRELKKGAHAQIVGGIHFDREVSFIGLGQPAKSVKCPGCGTAIECERMLSGESEADFTRTGIGVALIVGVAVALWMFGDAPWWQGALLGFLVGALVGRIWSYIELHYEA